MRKGRSRSAVNVRARYASGLKSLRQKLKVGSVSVAVSPSTVKAQGWRAVAARAAAQLG